jgi:hypothetical protein
MGTTLPSQGEHRYMGKDVILLGEVAERGARTIEIRCHRCDRHGRLSIARLLREYAPQTPLWMIWDPLIGDCPKREVQNLAERCQRLLPRPGAAVLPARCGLILVLLPTAGKK